MTWLGAATNAIRSSWHVAAAFVIYLICALALFGHQSLLSGHSYVGASTSTDVGSFAWWLYWWPHAIVHGQNPFVSHDVWAPQGANTASATSVPTLALLAAPITAAWGPVVAYNILALASPALCATATYWVCWLLTRGRIASLVGGWMFGFSTYEISHLMNDLNIFFVAWVPCLVGLVILAYRYGLGPRRLALFSALVVLLEAGTSVEILATMSVMAAVTAMCAVALVPESRARVRSVALPIVIGYAIAAIVALPIILAVLDGLHTLGGMDRSSIYVSDVANLVVPSPLTEVGGQTSNAVSAMFTGNIAESTGYVGFPALLLCCWWFSTHWSSRWARVLLAVISTATVLSFGPVLHLFGHDTVAGPWALLQALPLLGLALPARLMLYADLGIAIVIALLIAEAAQVSLRRLTLSLGAVSVVVASLLPVPRGGYWLTAVDTPALFLDPSLAGTVLPRGSTAVVVPYADRGNSMLWQAQDHLAFRMAGGYTGNIPLDFYRYPAVQMLEQGSPGPGFALSLKQFAHDKGVDEIAIVDTSLGTWRGAMATTGWSHVDVGGVTVYRVS